MWLVDCLLKNFTIIEEEAVIIFVVLYESGTSLSLQGKVWEEAPDEIIWA
jgi:hypothetical protein